MAVGDDERYLTLRGKTWHFCRSVPVDLVSVIGRRLERRSLKTDSLDLARKRRDALCLELDRFWASLRAHGGDSSASERFSRAVALAQSLGLTYRPIEELAHPGQLDEIVRRIEIVETHNDAPAIVEAALGLAPEPKLTLSSALEEYWKLTRGDVVAKSADQLRRWKNPRKKAVNNFIEVVGDKSVADISRKDALIFRAWWVDRILEEDLTANSANKDITHLQGILRRVSDDLGLGLDTPFSGLSLREETPERASWTKAEMVDTILKPDVLSGMSPQLRALIWVVMETGARLSEICGLQAEDILLGDEVPHISIRPNAVRELKNAPSRRSLPLVGWALTAMQAFPSGLTDYLGRNTQASAAVGKFLREHSLLPSEKHTLYSLRHGFQDRLIEVEAPERVQAELMGHALSRPRYGAGASLKQKREWLERISVTADRPLLY